MSAWAAGVASAVVVLLALVAFVPTGVGDLTSHAAPARDYADAVARVSRRQNADDRLVEPGGQSLLLVHGRRTPRAVLLLHGFTNSPRQFRDFAARLFASGDNVYVPRLPRHAERGGTAATLAGLTAEELRNCADSAVDVTDGLGDSIVVVGLSVGGTMAAWIAQYRADVRRSVVIAPTLEIARVPSMFAKPLVNLALRMPNITRADPPNPARSDRELGTSSHAIGQMLRLGAAVRRAADRAPPRAAEVAFVVNANDHTVKTAPVLELASRWGRSRTLTAVYQLPDSLRLAHDVIDPGQPNAKPDVVYALLEALAHGERPPAFLSDHRARPR